jgi:DNA-directed RNA polymerase specialized sigma24 family protein
MDEVRLLVLKLRRLLRSRGRSIDDADDLIQEAFLRPYWMSRFTDSRCSRTRLNCRHRAY